MLRVIMKLNKAIFFAATLLSSAASYANLNDHLQEVQISAVKQTANIDSNSITFYGPVTVTQGSMKILATQLDHLPGKNNSVLVATGKPATYQQMMENGLMATASADKITYDLSLNTLVMHGSASLSQDGSTIKGERIEYNIATKDVLAESNGEQQDRVITIIQPSQLNNNEE